MHARMRDDSGERAASRMDACKYIQISTIHVTRNLSLRGGVAGQNFGSEKAKGCSVDHEDWCLPCEAESQRRKHAAIDMRE